MRRLVLKDLINLLLKEGRGPQSALPGWRSLTGSRAGFWEESQGRALNSDAVPIKPQRIIQALNQRLPSPSIVIADAGTPTPYITRFLKLQGGGSRFLNPPGLSVAWGMPSLPWLAPLLPAPERGSWPSFGDGSLGMSAGELETLVRLKIPAVLIHFNNGCFGWIKALQALHCKSKFLSVDFTAGQHGTRRRRLRPQGLPYKSPGELEKGLDEAFASQTPVFLDVVTESELSELPPVYSWLKKAGKKGRT